MPKYSAYDHPEAQYMKVVDGNNRSLENKYVLIVDTDNNYMEEALLDEFGKPKVEDGKPVISRTYGVFKVIDKRTNLPFA